MRCIMKLNYSLNLDNLPADINDSLKFANVFYTKEFEQLNKDEGKETLYIYNDSLIILVLVTCKYRFKYADLPVEYFIWNTNADTDFKNAQNFLDECMVFLRDTLNVMWVNQPSSVAMFKSYPSDSVRISFGSYVIDLQKSEEEIWGNFRINHRNYTRQAEKLGVIVKYGCEELIDEFYTLYKENMKRSNIEVEEKNYYYNLCIKLKPYAKIYIAYKEDSPQAALFVLYNNALCFAMYGGNSNTAEKGSNILLHWRTMCHMKALGVSMYSFGGFRLNVDKDSKYFNIQSFKARFGCELKEGFLFKVVLNKFMHKLYIVLVKTKLILYKSKFSGDVIDQELHKWKEINE